MSRPLLEVADLVRSAGAAFIGRNRNWIRWTHIKVLLAIARCRTAALGGHIDECTRCGHRATISYNSCRNRHCPKCQTGARERWIQARRRELLPSPYVHVVFTLPSQLAALALQNKKIVYSLLLRASAETLLEVARNPTHLGAEIGFFSVLHTWNQKLQIHPHVHCVVAAGGLSLDHTRWIRSHPRFFLPIPVLRRVFRGKFVAGLKAAFQLGQLHLSGDLALLAQPKFFAAWLRPLFRKNWVVYSKPPFGGPEYVLQYLGRYAHRVAISNHRLISLANGQVTFRWRDSAHHNEQKLMTLSLDEFLRRFLLHLLPKGFVRIRHFGFLANRRRSTLLPLCFAALGTVPAPMEPETTAQESHPLWRCPKCGGPMAVIERLTAAQIQLRSPPPLLPTTT
ncbi:MAG: IS91 family transposase [Candidatus Sulfotelmatobacter sp.]